MQSEKIKSAARALYQRRAASKIASVLALYRSNPKEYRARARAAYKADPERKKAAAHAYFAINHSARLKSYRKYHCCHKKDISLRKKARYNLAHPKPVVTELSVNLVLKNLLSDSEALSELKEAFTKKACAKGFQ